MRGIVSIRAYRQSLLTKICGNFPRPFGAGFFKPSANLSDTPFAHVPIMHSLDPTTIQTSLHTQYGILLLRSGEPRDETGMENFYEGQRNGLLGGALRSRMDVYLGVHTGAFRIDIDINRAAPAIDESWEEIVEASCFIEGGRVVLSCFAAAQSVCLPLQQAWYRARLHVNGYGESERLGVFGDPAIEYYKLIFWPDEPKDDAILKQTREAAIARHRLVSKTVTS